MSINKEVTLKGKVSSGMGRARFFMSQPNYRRQFISKLGFDPYPGTFNIKLSGRYILMADALRRRKSIFVKGFKKEGREFGGVLCYNAEILGIACVLIIPEKSMHKDVVELISQSNLRRQLSLKDGSPVQVTVKFN